MAFCKNCGAQVNDQAVICTKCGAALGNQPSAQNTPDNGGFGWGLLGFCIPIAGLILFLVWKDTKPKSSKAAGIGALVSVILVVVFYVLMFVLGLGLSSMYY